MGLIFAVCFLTLCFEKSSAFSMHFEMEAHFDVLKGVGFFYILHLEII
jgi:hypothetical protein